MKKVLVVDDNMENSYILQKLIESQKMIALVASHGKEALDIALGNPPDLIISDILMPVMDGYALCKVWKAEETLRHIPFIFYTATYTEPKDEAFALKLGAHRFVVKPQEPHVIINMIQEFLQEHPPLEKTAGKPLGSEMEFFRQHNEILFNKLEKKILDLEDTNQRLSREIEERKRTEEKLMKLTQAIEESPVSVVITDLDGNVEYANPMFLQISGYSGEDGEGRKMNVLKSAEMSSDLYKELWLTITKNSVWRGEVCNRRKDGKPFWMYLTTLPIKNADGVINGFLAIMEDISERRKLEEQLRQAQKLEGIGELAGGIAHDFNNILTAIIGYAHLTYFNMQQGDPLRNHIKQILDYSEKAASVTKSLLAFSRKQVTHLKYLNLNDLVSQFQKFLMRLMPENIDIQTQYSDQILYVLVDQVQVEQVIMNLATNARDAMPAGGRMSIATKLVEADEEFIETRGNEANRMYAELTVTDTGIGMNDHTREKIFEPFFTTKEQGKGTGLGLAIVYGIIKKHNGHMSVESEEGKGTVFRILLPIAHSGATGAAKESEIIKFSGGTETILVAEDDPGIRDLIAMILTENGYQVISAADGEEAVSKFSESIQKVDLVMLDGIMPKKSGKEVLNEIRVLKPDVKAVFMSGYSANMIDREALQGGEVRFLQKPVMPSDILKTVRSVLDHVRTDV